LSTLDKISGRVSTIEQNLSAIDAALESTGVALANAQGRLVAEQRRAQSEAEAVKLEAQATAISKAHIEFAGATQRLVTALKASRPLPTSGELATFLTRLVGDAAQSNEITCRELRSAANAERTVVAPMPERVAS